MSMNLSIYYIFKCWLHYLAMFKLFQRIIFACLTKEFLHVAIFFSIFQFEFSVFFVKIEICNPKMGCYKGYHRRCELGPQIRIQIFFTLRDKKILVSFSTVFINFRFKKFQIEKVEFSTL